MVSSNVSYSCKFDLREKLCQINNIIYCHKTQTKKGKVWVNVLELDGLTISFKLMEKPKRVTFFIMKK